MRSGAIFLLLILLYSCTDKEIINVQINQDKLIIADREIEKVDFETELNATIEKKRKEGFEKSELVIHVKVDETISQAEMSEIEKAIRRLGMSREYFWTN